MSAVVGEGSMAELHEQRDFLLRSLQDLEAEREAGDLDDADYQSLRDSYTARAAAVLRAIDAAEATGAPATSDDPAGTTDGAVSGTTDSVGAGTTESAVAGTTPAPAGTDGSADTPAPAAGTTDAAAGTATRSQQVAVSAPATLASGAPTGTRPRRRWGRPIATAAAVLALAGVAGGLMARSAGERLPGEAATGSLTATGASSELERARLLIGQGKTLEAIKTFDKVLREDPRQPEALAYRGWLLRLAGRAGGDRSLIDSGMAFIERAVAADPSYPDAHFFRGVILFQDRGDPAGAVTEFRAFLANDPPPAMIPVVEDSLRRALAASQSPQPQPPAPPSSQP